MPHLHVAHGNTVVLAISDHLVFNLLPALHTLLNEHLRADGESLFTQVRELLVVGREPRPKTSKRKRGTNNDGKSNLCGSSKCFGKVDGGSGFSALFANLLHCPREFLPIFRRNDRVDGRTEHLDPELGELVLELDTDVQGGLSTKRAVDPVGLLMFDYSEDKVGCHGQEVDLVGETFRRLDSGNVGVDQDSVDTFLFQRLDGLRSGIVEFSRLADRETS